MASANIFPDTLPTVTVTLMSLTMTFPAKRCKYCNTKCQTFYENKERILHIGGALLPTVLGSNKVPSGLRPPSIFLNKD